MFVVCGVWIVVDVVVEGWVGYGVFGDYGNVFEDLIVRVV